MTGMMQSTGDLVKSVGKFSLATALLAARQVTAIVSRPKDVPSAADDVTRAAGGHLSGAVRTAFAVGTNVQCGLVDAVFNAAGMGPKGQAPVGDTTALTVPLMTGIPRRVAGVKTVASGAVDRGVTQAELVERLTQYQTDSIGRPVERAKAVIGLWKSEGLSTSVGKHLLAENSLADPKLPREVLPISHVGFGSGSTEEMVFDVAKLNALFAERCAPGGAPEPFFHRALDPVEALHVALQYLCYPVNFIRPVLFEMIGDEEHFKRVSVLGPVAAAHAAPFFTGRGKRIRREHLALVKGEEPEGPCIGGPESFVKT